MPRYHLHIHCDGEVIMDDEGGEFFDEAAAVKEAVRSIRSLVCGDVVGGALDLDLSIEIRDDRDKRLQEVLFEDAITSAVAVRSSIRISVPSNPLLRLRRGRGRGRVADFIRFKIAEELRQLAAMIVIVRHGRSIARLRRDGRWHGCSFWKQYQRSNICLGPR